MVPLLQALLQLYNRQETVIYLLILVYLIMEILQDKQVE